MGNNAAAALKKAGISHELHWLKSEKRVFVTRANQLIGEHNTLKEFRKENPDYKDWDSHHIVEKQDLARLGIEAHMPHQNRQVCVLLPATAHQKRVNSILRRYLPRNILPSENDLLEAYQEAYDLIGNYCGSNKHRIRHELMALVRSILKMNALNL